MPLLRAMLRLPPLGDRAALGLWILGWSCACIAAAWAPLILAIPILPRDANPIGLGLLAVFGSGAGVLGVVAGALLACLGSPRSAPARGGAPRPR